MVDQMPTLGFEYDWFGVDSAGNLGMFSTAGQGWTPDESRLSQEAYEELHSKVRELPQSFDVSRAEDRIGKKNDWVNLAGRGFFAFDWDSCSGAYTLMARALSPLKSHELKIDMAGFSLLSGNFEETGLGETFTSPDETMIST